MRPTAFVAVLFIMAAACVLVALSSRSWGWLIGGAVFAAVGMFARGQMARELEVGRAPPRLGFVAVAMLAMVVAILVIALI